VPDIVADSVKPHQKKIESLSNNDQKFICMKRMRILHDRAIKLVAEFFDISLTAASLILTSAASSHTKRYHYNIMTWLSFFALWHSF